MSTRYAELIAAIRKYSATTTIPGIAQIMGNLAEFLATLAEDAAEQTEKNLALQAKLVSLTRILAALTFVLFLFTAYLCYKAYLQDKCVEQHHTDHS